MLMNGGIYVVYLAFQCCKSGHSSAGTLRRYVARLVAWRGWGGERSGSAEQLPALGCGHSSIPVLQSSIPTCPEWLARCPAILGLASGWCGGSVGGGAQVRLGGVSCACAGHVPAACGAVWMCWAEQEACSIAQSGCSTPSTCWDGSAYAWERTWRRRRGQLVMQHQGRWLGVCAWCHASCQVCRLAPPLEWLWWLKRASRRAAAAAVAGACRGLQAVGRRERGAR